MPEYVSDVAFTPSVKAEQDQRGSRAAYARMERKRGWRATITEELAAFVAESDSFYLATTNNEGHPYIQHRGGPRGFLKVVDERTLAFADFSGNKQYITLGNLADNDKAFIFLMDYANRRRIKIWGRARVVENDDELLERLADPAYPAPGQRVILFRVEAWDVNCPQHITPRYTEAELLDTTEPLRRRIADLEAELAVLRARPEPAIVAGLSSGAG